MATMLSLISDVLAKSKNSVFRKKHIFRYTLDLKVSMLTQDSTELQDLPPMVHL